MRFRRIIPANASSGKSTRQPAVKIDAYARSPLISLGILKDEAAPRARASVRMNLHQAREAQTALVEAILAVEQDMRENGLDPWPDE